MGLTLSPVLERYCGINWHEPASELTPLMYADGSPSGLLYTAYPLVGKPPRYMERHVIPQPVNAVLHRENMEHLGAIIALAEELDAQRLELANTQFLGWAFKNKEALLPTCAQVEEAEKVAAAAQARLRGKMEVLYVLPDYYGERPKPCMNGWGRRFLTVNPMGDVLPCQTAGAIPSLHFDNVRQHPLHWIWNGSEAFNRFRGTDWMPEPCRSCPQCELDFGGCRCQAFLLTDDAANTDFVAAYVALGRQGKMCLERGTAQICRLAIALANCPCGRFRSFRQRAYSIAARSRKSP